MRIRTQLILAAFLLAVVPLAAIVGYSYTSSREALELAYRTEADRLTKQMDRRLAAIRADLDQRLTVVSALPISDKNPNDVNSIVTVMGDSASLVDALEFQPVHAPEPPRRLHANHEAPVVAPAPVARPEQESIEPAVAATVDESDTPETASDAAPPPPHAPRHPIVIEMPAIVVPRYVMSREQSALVGQVTALASRLMDPQLTAEQRQELQQELQESQEELRRVAIADRRVFKEHLRDAQRTAREQRAAIEAAREASRERSASVTAPTLSPDAVPVPEVAAVAGATVVPDVPPAPARQPAKKRVAEDTTRPTAGEQANAAASEKRTSLLFGRRFETPVRSQGEVVGQLRAHVSPEQVVRRVLGASSEEAGELAFAVDRENNVYTRNPEERAQLDTLGITDRMRRGQSLKGIDGWIVSSSVDPQSGLRIGVARPVGENLLLLRRAAARNFGLGLGMIAFALIGMIPLTNHLTRDVKLVTEGAERIAHGDLMTRLPVKTKNELGQLATAFNRMAEDLSLNQQKLVEQERTRKEQELQQTLLAVEYERKSVELEDARRFQLSMLPKQVPQHPSYDVAVFTRTATEVGGDYYDFHLAGDALTVTIGDATGHGAKAGTMVTVVKTMFAGYDTTIQPAKFLTDAAETIKRMDLGRMAMSLSVARFEKGRLTLASAGMPPGLVHRKETGTIEELGIAATPLGTLGVAYDQTACSLRAGDTVLFLSDGLPELMNADGHQLGYPGALEAFESAARAESADGVIATLAARVDSWRGDSAPNDDVTFVVVRVS